MKASELGRGPREKTRRAARLLRKAERSVRILRSVAWPDLGHVREHYEKLLGATPELFDW